MIFLLEKRPFTKCSLLPLANKLKYQSETGKPTFSQYVIPSGIEKLIAYPCLKSIFSPVTYLKRIIPSIEKINEIEILEEVSKVSSKNDEELKLSTNIPLYTKFNLKEETREIQSKYDTDNSENFNPNGISHSSEIKIRSKSYENIFKTRNTTSKSQLNKSSGFKLFATDKDQVITKSGYIYKLKNNYNINEVWLELINKDLFGIIFY